MTIHYVDASAWVKLIYEESETEAMLDHLEFVGAQSGRFVSCYLLATELNRSAVRLRVSPKGVFDALCEVTLLMPSSSTFDLAGRLPGENLRSLDALHVASAIESGADAFLTYDMRQAEAANDAGIAVISPK